MTTRNIPFSSGIGVYIKLNRLSGVYALRHKPSGKAYIGYSSNLDSRWKAHIADLRGGRHKKRELQELFNAEGEQAFEFLILEYTYGYRQVSTQYEQFWIRAFHGSRGVFNTGPELEKALKASGPDSSNRQIAASQILELISPNPAHRPFCPGA